MKPLKIDFYYDFSCPWCYIGYIRLADAIKKYGKPVELHGHTYLIDTGINSNGENMMDYCVRRWGSDSWTPNLKSSGSKDGVAYKSWKYWQNSFHIHRLMIYARAIKYKDISVLVSRLFSGIYEEGKNFSSLESVINLAEEIGVPDARAILESGQYREEVFEEDDFAKCDLQIEAVPFFIVNDKYYLEGANPSSAFVNVFQMVEKADARQ